MLHRKTLKPNQVTTVTKKGSEFKLLTAQTELRVTFYRKGEEMLVTDARSGFELSGVNFDEILISGEQEQRIEIWASEIKLGYDAPSANANNLSSFKGLHYGDSEVLLPFEPSRLTARVVSDSPWWYGGANVDSDNGIPVAAGEIAEIRGAAEIKAAISAKGEYLTTTQTVDTGDRPWLYGSFNNNHGLVIRNNDAGIDLLTKGGLMPVNTSKSVSRLCKVGEDGVAYIEVSPQHIYVYNFETNKTVLINVPSTPAQAVNGVYITQAAGIVYNKGKYILSAKCYDTVRGEDLKALAIFDGQSWAFKFVVYDRNASFPNEMYPISDDSILLVGGNKLYISEVDSLPDGYSMEIDPYGQRIFLDLEMIQDGFAGTLSYLSYSSYGGYVLLKSQSINSEAVLINEADKSAVNIGRCQLALISEAGLIKANGNDWLLSKDYGGTYEPITPTLSFPDGANVHAGYYGGVVLVASTSLTGYILTEKQRQNPKQNFRILKAFS
tara:strand:+ start:2411 stop:3898 length:1488 start_codon:yes stop_codon:yes gene_type:complete